MKEQVELQCIDRVSDIGRTFGKDRVRIHTVAFGPPSESYGVLDNMSKVLPRSSFQKLGLAAANLKSAFSSLTGTLTSLRSESLGPSRSSTMTPRVVDKEDHSAEETPYSELTTIDKNDGWHIYYGRESGMKCRGNLISKRSYDWSKRKFISLPLSKRHPAIGIAMMGRCFATGAERYAFKCTEVVGTKSINLAFGSALVAKESVYEETLIDSKSHKKSAMLQAEASSFASRFNRRVSSALRYSKHASRLSAYNVSYVDVFLYKVEDWTYYAGIAWILAEERLEGRFQKWNNNAGRINTTAAKLKLDIIEEEDEDEDDNDESINFELDEIPQCFSHFSWSDSDGRCLVCDIQGVWNKKDGFVLTDPVIHTNQKRKNGSTDKAEDGFHAFFF